VQLYHFTIHLQQRYCVANFYVKNLVLNIDSTLVWFTVCHNTKCKWRAVI